MPLLNAVLGGLLLLFGRSLYWVFVAIGGFLIGGQFAEVALADQAQWVQLLAALAGGIVGALLAMLAQRVAFGIGGFFAGGYLATLLARSLHADGNEMVWVLLGGFIGAVIAVLVMDWAIIVLSSMVGAGAIVAALALEPSVAALIYVLLLVVGIVVQASRLPRAQSAPG
ncbi:MAG: TM7S3/TM198-like domain-containing protein [Aureliella sp.]